MRLIIFHYNLDTVPLSTLSGAKVENFGKCSDSFGKGAFGYEGFLVDETHRLSSAEIDPSNFVLGENQILYLEKKN